MKNDTSQYKFIKICLKGVLTWYIFWTSVCFERNGFTQVEYKKIGRSTNKSEVEKLIYVGRCDLVILISKLPKPSEKIQMFYVTRIFLDQKPQKYFLKRLWEHTVHMKLVFAKVLSSIIQVRRNTNIKNNVHRVSTISSESLSYKNYFFEVQDIGKGVIQGCRKNIQI